MIALLVLAVLTGLLVVVTILSFLHISHGFYRVFSFPRLQFSVAAITLFIASLVFLDLPRWEWALLSAQIACFVAQGWAIAQFLPVRPSQSDVYDGPPDQPNMVSVLSYNVKMSNVRFQEAIDLVRMHEPDIAIFMETDEKWDEAMSVLADDWPNHVREPLDNSYGMLLYSRPEAFRHGAHASDHGRHAVDRVDGDPAQRRPFPALLRPSRTARALCRFRPVAMPNWCMSRDW